MRKPKQSSRFDELKPFDKLSRTHAIEGKIS